MSTINACEDYVVRKLIESEALLAEYASDIVALKEEISTLKANLDFIGSRMYIDSAYSDGTPYVKFTDCWEKYDKESFDRVVDIFDLTMPEPEAENDENA